MGCEVVAVVVDVDTAGEEKPVGRCSHTCTAIGNNLFIFGGLAPAVPDNKIVPTNDVFTLVTGLNYPIPPDPVVEPAQDSNTNTGTKTPPDLLRDASEDYDDVKDSPDDGVKKEEAK